MRPSDALDHAVQAKPTQVVVFLFSLNRKTHSFELAGKEKGFSANSGDFRLSCHRLRRFQLPVTLPLDLFS
jgi:hypothetical protein